MFSPSRKMFLKIVILVSVSAVTGRNLPAKLSQTNSTKVSLVDYFTGGFVHGYDGNETGPDWLYNKFHLEDESHESDYNTKNDLNFKKEIQNNSYTPIEGRRLEKDKKSEQAAKKTNTLRSKHNDNSESGNSTQISNNETWSSTRSHTQGGQILPVDEDRWIWDDGGSVTTTKKPKINTTAVDIDDRTAFDGSSCPKGQVWIRGVNMCVDTD